MLKAIIFDCDGVIVNSEPAHLAAFQKVLAEEGISLSRQEYLDRYLAMDDQGCFRAVFSDHQRPLDETQLKACLARKAGYYDTISRSEGVVFDGVEKFARAAAKHYPMAIASGALRPEVLNAVRTAGIESCFKTIVTAEDVRRGKPDPESFQLALRRLGELTGAVIGPSSTLVFEDSKHGVFAAKAAGMKCVGVTTSYSASELSAADRIIGGFHEMTVEKAEDVCR